MGIRKKRAINRSIVGKVEVWALWLEFEDCYASMILVLSSKMYKELNVIKVTNGL